MKKEYRTDEQFNTMCENMINGNWSHAARNCVDFGFYANDILNKHYGLVDMEMNSIQDVSDFVILIEMATELRNN